MKIYINRKDQKYIDFLRDLLVLENLKENAIHISKPKTIDGVKYDKFIRIDLIYATFSWKWSTLKDVNVFQCSPSLRERHI